MAGIKLITPPATEPVSLSDVKNQLRIDLDDDSYDSTLEPLVTAAVEWCEGYQNRAYITRTLEVALDRWPAREIKLPRPPLQSVASLTYTDDVGNTETWPASNYIINDYNEPARIVRKTGVNWPSVCLASVNGIKVRYVAGYGSAEDVPRMIKQAIILLVATWFDNPGCEPPDAVKSLLNMDRVVPV